MRPIRRFLALDSSDRLYLLEAWLYLAASRLALSRIPFRYLAPRLGRQLPLEQGENPLAASSVLARTLTHAVGVAARHTPWNSTCLVQAIAGRLILRRRGLRSRIFLGTRKDEKGNLAAHAWLQSGDEILLGAAGRETFTALSSIGDPLPP